MSRRSSIVEAAPRVGRRIEALASKCAAPTTALDTLSAGPPIAANGNRVGAIDQGVEAADLLP